MTELTHISLFSGIGGIDLAAEWAGFRTILFVEIDKYCQKVLKKRWPDVPIVDDIRSFNGEEYRGAITIITGGFPCQPVSHAGKRRGKEDDRWLWPEMLRLISEVKSTWVVAENVTGLLHLGFNDCISDLESIGYETTSFLIPACGVNAPHRRDRIFIVAKTRYDVWPNLEVAGNDGQAITDNQKGQERSIKSARPSSRQGRNKDVADTNNAKTTRQQRYSREIYGITESTRLDISSGKDWWATEPELGRVAHGIPHRVDRLKCLGNAVVPQQIYPILQAIADIERGYDRP